MRDPLDDIVDAETARSVPCSERSVLTFARCYLCGERRPKAETEVRRYRVPSAARGGTLEGVNRYVRMCRVGSGCR